VNLLSASETYYDALSRFNILGWETADSRYKCNNVSTGADRR
jgi:hypothetical protein